VAAVFTRNQFAAAPVRLCREVLASGMPCRAVLVNSGNANACTGTTGDEDAREMQELAAKAIGCAPAEVMVCSTGRIGEDLPMERIRSGIPDAVERLGANGD